LNWSFHYSITPPLHHSSRLPQGGKRMEAPSGDRVVHIMPHIIYLPKDELYPKFGYAQPSKQIAYVREDLPGYVKKFVTVHECYHLADKAQRWVWREIRANIAGAIKHPIGFVVCVLMSLEPYRLKYYWQRIIGKA
jgi:hypothetical protein